MTEEKEYYALTKKSFDFLALFYNIMTLPLIRVRDQVVDFVNAEKDSAILDVANGKRRWFIMLLRHCLSSRLA